MNTSTALPTNSLTASTPRRVDALLAHYGESHQNPTNEAIHYVAIPLIVLSLLGLLFALHPWLAYAAVAAGLVYYARLSLVFLGCMVVFSALALVLVHALGIFLVPVCQAVFVLAWIAQFVGHIAEGKKPSFFEDLQYLLVGPLFVLSKLFVRMKWQW